MNTKNKLDAFINEGWLRSALERQGRLDWDEIGDLVCAASFGVAKSKEWA